MLAVMAAAPPAHRKHGQSAARATAVSHLAQTEQERQAREQEEAAARKTEAAAQAQADLLAAERVREAASLRHIEGAVAASTESLREASDAGRAAEAELARREADFAKLLPLVLRMARFPAETVLAVPGPPERALEGLLIARFLARQLNQQAATLAAARDHAAVLRHDVALRTETLSGERATQQAAAARLETQLQAARAHAAQAQEAGAQAAREAQAIAAQATTLRGAILAMDAAEARARTPEPPDSAFPSATGVLATPVAGRVTRGWGQPAEDGPATGITYATAPSAYVASPCAGRIAFAAPFRSYGQLLIVECRGGLDIVLAGLARLDATVGRAVRQGEPVGRMASAATPSLYVELRRGGAPIDPAPFLNTKG
jgi:murein DD-endopeptidase MepM/ murein hydrolase activator NlpD